MPAGAPTTDCDEGCNVIGGSAIGIDLNGDGAGQNEAPASWPDADPLDTSGLNFGGLGVVTSQTIPTQFGIDVGAAKNVVVGGTSISGEPGTSIESRAANTGSTPKRPRTSESSSTPSASMPLAPRSRLPSAVGIFNLALGVTEPATISRQRP